MRSKGHLSWNENLQRKQNSIAKSANLKENAGKIKSAFAIKAALCAEKFGRSFEYCRSWKNTLGKFAVAGNTEVIQFEFGMKGALDVTVAIFVLCGWRFLNHFHIVSETPYSCDTVGCELRRVILCSLLCPETDKNTRRKARLCVYFNRFLKAMFWYFIPDINLCQRLFWDWELLE